MANFFMAARADWQWAFLAENGFGKNMEESGLGRSIFWLFMLTVLYRHAIRGVKKI